jgi:DNA-binding NarL/FixJ family response regulator
MKILIADDHPLFRDGLRGLIESYGLEVVGEAENGLQVVEMAHRLAPDVVLMDLSMPGLDGLAATRRLVAELPDVRIVVLTATDDDQKLFEAIKAGAQGYLLKNLHPDDLVALLDKVKRGEPALSPAMSRRLLAEIAQPAPKTPEPAPDLDTLTEKERQVLTLMVSGVDSNRRLSRELGISENTVKTHVRQILDKLHLHSRGQAIAYAYRHALVAPPPEGG